MTRACLLLLAGLLLEGGAPVPQGRPPIETFAKYDHTPTGSVELVLTDAAGRTWVGTQDGLWTFDGTLWTRVPLPDLPDGRAWIFSGLAAPNGDLWFGTNGQGLLHRTQGRWQRVGPGEGLPSQNISALARDPRGEALWIGSHDHGLWVREGNRFRPVPPPEDGPLPPVNTLSAEAGPSGTRLFVGTYRGLYLLEEGRWRLIGPGGAARSWVMSVALEATPSGSVAWVGTRAGLFRWDGATWEGPAGGLPSDYIYTLATGPSPIGGDTLWVGTPSGLSWKNGASWVTLGARNHLPADYIRSIATTGAPGHPRQVWVGTQDGLARLAPGLWQSLDADLGLAQDQVTALHEEADGALWFGHASGGISRWRGGRWDHHRIADAQAQPAVYAFATVHRPGRPPQVLAGTRGKGVLAWDGRGWTQAPWSGRLPDPNVYALQEDPHQPGTLWIGTNRGLACLRGERLEVPAAGAPDSRVECLVARRDAAGNEEVWVGTRNLGLWRLRKGSWSRVGLGAGFTSTHVSALWDGRDAAGHPRLWVGTLGSGAFLVDPDQPERPWVPFSPPSASDALDTFITGIRQDARGRAYVFTYRGVVQSDPVEGIRLFNRHDGLPSDGCSLGAHLLDQEGRLWVGTARGAAFMDPRWVRPAAPVAPPRFEEIHATPSGRGLTPGIHLSHRERGIRIRLGMATYHRESDHRFRFQVEGLEPGPTDWSASPVRELAALPPGDYTLLAWVRSPEGATSRPTRLAFSVGYAPWAHPLALALYGAAAVGAVFLLFRLRIGLLKQRGRLLQAQVAAATAELRDRNQDLAKLNAQEKQLLHLLAHDLRNPLSTVTLMAEEIRESEDAGEAREVARRIQEVSASMSALLGRILELEALESGAVQFEAAAVDLEGLLRQVVEEFTPSAARKRQVLDLAPGAGRVIADPRFTLEVARNLVSNAVKYSPLDGRILIRPIEEGNFGGFGVLDEGQGIPAGERDQLFAKFAKLSPRPTQGEPSAGVGLANARLVVERMGGLIRFHPGPGERGADFQVLLPRA